MKLTKKTIEQWIYTSENGREIAVADMDARHLLNAYTKAIEDGESDIADVLRSELLRRLYNQPLE